MLSMLLALLGGWDKALHVLVVILIAEYFTGMLAAFKQKKVNCDVLGWSVVRKVLILFVVGLAALLDGWNEQGPPIFRMAAIYFYCGREGLSLLDHLGANGIPLPQVLKDFLKQLSEQKGERTNRKSRL